MTCACTLFPDGAISLCAAHSNWYNKLSERNISHDSEEENNHRHMGLIIAMEWGFRRGESHQYNLQCAIHDFKILIGVQ